MLHSLHVDTLAQFQRVVGFLCALFAEPEPFAAADCRDSFKTYARDYYRQWFGASIEPMCPRHLQWYRRLAPVLALPPGSHVVDFGGGFGIDSLVLASLGHSVTFYELSRHHIGIAKALAERYATRYGPLQIQFVCARKESLPAGMDAVMLDEVAHHIEPVEEAFDIADRMLKPGGSLFLLEPNFLSLPVQVHFYRVRGFHVVGFQRDIETGELRRLGREHIRLVCDWAARARKFGFRLVDADYVVPWMMRNPQPNWLRHTAEHLPLVREVFATHVTMHFAKP